MCKDAYPVTCHCKPREKRCEAIKINKIPEFDVMTFYHVGTYINDPTVKETEGIYQEVLADSKFKVTSSKIL